MKEDQKIAIYQTEDGQTQIDVRLENETVWLNVAQMASLFMKEESNVRWHVLNAFKEGELERSDNNVHFLHVNGVKKPVPFYSLGRRKTCDGEGSRQSYQSEKRISTWRR